VAVSPSDNGSSHVDKVTLRRPRLVLSLRCMTIYQYTTSVCNQPLGWLSLLPSLRMEISSGQGTVAVLCAGKVTIGLALHQPRVTGSVIYPPTGWMA